MIKLLKRISKGNIIVLFVPIIAFAGSEEVEYDFDWYTIGKDLGVQITAEDYEALSQEMLVGQHVFDIYLNKTFLCQERVEITQTKDREKKLVVAVPIRVFKKVALNEETAEMIRACDPNEMVTSVENIIPSSRIELDQDAQSIRLRIPQKYLLQEERTVVNEDLWDYGIPAWRLSYDFDASKTKADRNTTDRYFLSYESQMNLGAWRVFVRGNVSRASDSSTESDVWDKYATRVVPTIGAKLKVGEFNTTSRYMPSVPIVGINLYEDEEQLEDRDRSYIPVIAGFAPSQSLVTVRQGGRVLKQMEVAPGPFEFSDLLPVGNSGNIELEIKENNGQISTYIIPYTSNNRLLKEKRFSWSGSVGKYDDGYRHDHPWIAEFSVGYGLPHGLTLYGGMLQSKDLSHYLIGSAYDAGRWGSLSLQFENSRVVHPDERRGNVLEMAWHKDFKDWGSALDLTYRRTIDGEIASISSVIESSSEPNNRWWAENDFVEDELSCSLSQTVADWGTLSGSFFYSRSKFGDEQKSLTSSFYFPIGRMSGTLQAQASHYDSSRWHMDDDWQVSFQLNIPLSLIFPDSSIPYSNLRMTRVQRNDSRWSNQVDFSSSFGRYSDWSVNMYARDDDEGHDAVNLGVSYSGGKVDLSMNAGRYDGTEVYAGHLSGSVLATEHGLTLSKNSFGGSVALVNVPNVNEARLFSSGLDTTGEWQVSNPLRNYRSNVLRVDPNSIPANVYMISGYEQDVIPADNSVISVRFDTFKGCQAVFTVLNEKGEPLPFASTVTVDNLPNVMEPGIVDELGQVYFTAVPEEGEITSKWSVNGELRSCHAPYSLKDVKKVNGIYTKTLNCR